MDPNKPAISCVISFLLLFVVSEGELVVERSPCPGQSAIYRCSVNARELRWIWKPVGRQQEEFLVIPALNQPRISDRLIGDQVVIFNITDVESSYISVVATVNEPVSLDGTRMTCAGLDQIIRVPEISLVPTALRVLKLSDNMSEVYIQPVTEGDTNSGISYQLSSSDTVIPWISLIKLSAPDFIVFFHCQYNKTFIIDACIFRDDSEDRNYTLHSNGTWTISQKCSPQELLVSCSNESWSEDIQCEKFDVTTHYTNAETTSELPMMTSITSPESFTTICAEQCSMSSNSNKYILEIIIGSNIGTFVLTLTTGIILGLLCGIKILRTKINKISNQSTTTSNRNMNLNKGPLYEEVEIHKNVELTTNISYDTIKKI